LGINYYNLQSEITVIKNYQPLTTGKDEIFLEDLKTLISMNVYPNVYKLLQVALTLPISLATCECSFSAMRRIKTWMRSTMVHNRFKRTLHCRVLAREHASGDTRLNVSN